MKNYCSHSLASVFLAFALGASSTQAAAPATPQGLITGKEFSDISSTSVAGLTSSPKFPDNPDAIFFFPYFEWAATGDIFTPPGDYSNNYGGQIVGYFYPPTTGDYVFFIAADDNAALYLSPDDNPDNKKLIAQETNWSNAREYESSGNSVVADKDSSQYVATEWETIDPFWGGALITLRQGQAYYIEAIFNEGGGGDNLSVAVIDPTFSIDLTLPIPGEFLSSDRTAGPVSIVEQPQSQAADERGAVTFRVLADGTPPYTYQWRKNGTDIADATDLTYIVDSASVVDNNAAYSVAVSGGQGTATSQDAVLTVTPDTTPPTVLGAKGSASLTEVVLTFSEALEQAPVAATANYQISSTSGSLNVTAADVSPSGNSVTLTTAQQTLGTKYTILISNLQDTAATPNTITANTKAVFFPTGKLIEQDGFIVFEAENYDRNLDDLWIRDTERGNPSGGVSMVVANGTGGGENSSKLEYDVEFKQAATYIIWYRASGNDGTDDSAWFHLDGARPLERESANDAAMTGFSGALDFVWRADSFGGADPMSVDILFPGESVIGLAQRENGSFFDKFVLTTDTDFAPSGFGPAETREGAPGLPTIAMTAPPAGETFSRGASVTLSAETTADSRVDIERVEFLVGGDVIGEAAAAPYSFTWSNVPEGVHVITARATDELRATATAKPISIAVGEVGLPFQQDDAGLVAMEAENFHGLQVAPDGHTWEFSLARADFSGGGHMQAVPDAGLNRNVSAELLAESPRLDYTVSFANTGTHYVWVRGADPAGTGGGSGDSVHAGIDSVHTPSGDRIDAGPGFNTAEWNWVGDLEAGDRATIEVASPGEHILNIWMREDGFLFDKLIVTSDENFTPTDVGPAESARVGGGQSDPAEFSLPTTQGNNIVVSWAGAGTLQSADAVTGPWTDVANANSPASLPMTGGQKFYRIRQ